MLSIGRCVNVIDAAVDGAVHVVDVVNVVNAFHVADEICVVMVGVVVGLLVAPVDVDVAAAIHVNIDTGVDDPDCVATGFD